MREIILSDLQISCHPLTTGCDGEYKTYEPGVVSFMSGRVADGCDFPEIQETVLLVEHSVSYGTFTIVHIDLEKGMIYGYRINAKK